MFLTYLSLLIAGILPVVCAGIAKAGRRDFDNNNPRAWLAQLDGYRARANAAQANGFEAFPFFAVAVLAAIATHADPATINGLAVAFVVARIAYIAMYLRDRASLRSLCWIAGHGCATALYVTAMWRAV